MYTILPRPQSPVELRALSRALRSNAAGVGRALRSAARRSPGRFDGARARALLKNIKTDLRRGKEEVGAEVGEFITSPHLLFQPIRLGFTLALPLSIPLFFMPTKTLLAYIAFVVLWYLLCACVFATEVAMRPPWYKKGLPVKDQPPSWKGCLHNPLVNLGLRYLDVEFPTLGSNSGRPVMLRGWFIPAPVAPTPGPSSADAQTRTEMVLFVHGSGRDRRAFLRHAKEFHERGMACLLFDLSEHGLSDSVTDNVTRGCSFGAREQYDIIAAAEYLRNSHGAKLITFVGTSNGASSAILAAARRPDLASSVIAENPYSRADNILSDNLFILSENYLSQNTHRSVRRAVFWLAGRVLLFRMGYFLQSFGAVDAAPRLTCPLLVAHSPCDDVVPYSHGVAVHEAAKQAKLDDDNMTAFFKVEDAAHCALYDKDPGAWTEAVLPFVESAFLRSKALSCQK